MTIDPARYNQAVMKASILEAVMDALAGKPVSDFMESFDEVDRARFAREALETIADPPFGCMTKRERVATLIAHARSAIETLNQPRNCPKPSPSTERKSDARNPIRRANPPARL